MPTATTARSPSRVRAELKRMGFFHATGLPWIEAEEDREGHIQARKQDYGYWGSDGRWIVAVLTNGEIWFCKTDSPSDECKKFLKQFCPKGRGAHIPCTNRRILDADHVAERIFDPYSFCGGYANPEPKPI